MGLTSGRFLAVLCLLSAAAFGAAVGLWPRLSGQRARTVLARAGALAGVQAITLITLAAMMNAYFEFYGSWGDLFGQATATPRIISHAGVRGARTERPGVVQTVRTPLAGGAPKAGEIRTLHIHGAYTGISTTAYAYLPPQYFQKPYAHARFPVIVQLTGYPGDAHNLVSRMKAPEIARGLLAHRRMRPAIIVMMRPTVVPPRDTECADVPGGPQVSTFFAQDLPTALTATYRIPARRSAWGLIGDSTGGYCALKLAMTHPDRFGAAVALSGYYGALRDFTTGDLYGGSKIVREENDLVWRLRHTVQPPISVLVTSSRSGERNLASTRRFMRLVHAPMKVASIILPRGGHNFTTWRRELPSALTWLSARL
jgi:pimeloyl-ACP methyl ester carboxylesterase